MVSYEILYIKEEKNSMKLGNFNTTFQLYTFCTILIKRRQVLTIG